jgi:hypothetical protein
MRSFSLVFKNNPSQISKKIKKWFRTKQSVLEQKKIKKWFRTKEESEQRANTFSILLCRLKTRRINVTMFTDNEGYSESNM